MPHLFKAGNTLQIPENTYQKYVFAELIPQEYPNIKVVPVSSVSEGIKLLNNGELYGYIGVLAVVIHQIDKDNYLNLTLSLSTPSIKLYRYKL